MNFGELQDAVKTNIIDLPTPVLEAVPTLVKRAHRYLQTRHNFFVMKTSKVQATSIGTRTLVAVPSDWKRPRKRPFWTDGGLARWMTFGQDSEVPGIYTDTDTGSPSFIVDNGINLEVWPLPDGLSQATGGEYTITVPYFKYYPLLSAAGDTDWFTENAEEYIEYAATAAGFAMDWDEAHSTYWDGRAKEKFTECVNADKERWLGALDTFAPNLGAYGPRTQR